jgi:hypothetical protein
MIAGWGTSGELGYSISRFFIHPLDIGLAAHVQPGIESTDRTKFLIDQAHACHL